MARLNPSLTVKFTAVVTDRVQQAYSELEGMAACAGINVEEGGKVEVADRAIYNNEGRVRTYSNGTEAFIPGRPWVDYATKGGDETKNFTKELGDVIRSNLKAPRYTKSSVQKLPRYDSKTGKYTTIRAGVGSSVSVFGADKYKKSGPNILMRKIAKQMADNQKQGIEGGLLAPNTESTKRRKKGDTPMVWTGEMLKSIKGFVE